MRCMHFVLMAALLGCSGPSSQDKGHTTDTDTETGTEPVEATMVRFDLTFEGQTVDCSVNEDGEFAGPSGYDLETTSELHVYTFGDGTLASSASDNLPYHVMGNDMIIAPAMEVTPVEGGATTTESITMNRFISGEWSCLDTDESVDETETMTVVYRAGHLVTLPDIGEIEVIGNTVQRIDGDYIIEGAFVAPTKLSLTITGGPLGDLEKNCWLGSVDDIPSEYR